MAPKVAQQKGFQPPAKKGAAPPSTVAATVSAPAVLTKASPAKKAAPPKKPSAKKGKKEESEESEEDFKESSSENEEVIQILYCIVISYAYSFSEEEIVVKKAVKNKIQLGSKAIKKEAKTSPKKDAKASPKKESPKKAQPVKKEAAPIFCITPKKEEKKVAKKKVEEDSDEEVGGEMDFLIPGQTKPTPDEGDPLRIFYESLYRQKPTSQMAEKYCIEYGLLSVEKAQEVLDRQGGGANGPKGKKK